MANNFTARDGSGVLRTFKSTEDGSQIHTPHRIIDSIAPGTSATSIGKAEDAVHGSQDVGVMALVVRKDIPAALASDGDYIPLIVDASGRLHVNVGATTPGSGATDLGKAEDAVHGSQDVGVMALAVRKDTAAALASDGDYIPLIVDASGRLYIAPLVAGTASIGKVIVEPATSGGCSPYRNIDVDESGAVVKASAGQLYGLFAINLHATDMRYLKVYDKSTTPSVGTDIPAITIPLKAGVPTPISYDDVGLVFTSGIGIGATAGIADNDTAAVGTSEVVVNIAYK